MDPKATGDAVRLFGLPADAWLRQNRLAPDELWPERESAHRSLWNARLFPLLGTPEDSLECALWLLDSARTDLLSPAEADDPLTSGPAAAREQWRAASRLSFEECQHRADRTLLRAYRRDLETEVILAQVRHALDFDGDVRSLRPAPQQIPRIHEMLSEELSGARGGMKAARACWIMADLLKTLDERWLEPVRTQAEANGRAFLKAAEYENRAFAEICQAIDLGVESPFVTPKLVLGPDQTVKAEAPIRVDFAGAWSDTPPYTLEHGGINLNVALRLDGELPLRAWVRPLPQPHLRLRALDLGAEVTLTRTAEALRYTDPRDPFALHKASLALLRILTPDGGPLAQQLEQFGGGLEITTESAVPKGSGLGTSSILGGVLLAALAKAMGVEWDGAALFEPVLALEQRLTTGGGWQDQIGGLVGGWKVTTTEPGLRQVPHVERLELPEAIQRALEERVILYYSGYTRLAKNILRTIVSQYLSRTASTLGVLHGIRPHTERMAERLLAGDLETVGALMDASTEFVAVIDPHSYPPHIARIVEAVRPHLSGAKPTGAGGGGFLLLLAKSGQDRREAEAILAGMNLPDGARPYPLQVDTGGLRVTVTRTSTG
jgi:galactokinase/mevalonate kinase-like predicted kinase